MIVGLAEMEALKRSISYTEAGVDAILIHMKVFSFYNTRLSGRITLGNHSIIWAVVGTQTTFKRILNTIIIAGIESKIGSVSDVF